MDKYKLLLRRDCFSVFRIGLVLALVFASQATYAQLITDSDARLKTVVKKREGFVRNQRKKRSYRPGQIPSMAKKVQPRYSQPVSHRRMTGKAIQPRYSPGSPFKPKSYRIKPRYSPDMGEDVVALSRPPRYSPGSPFKPKSYRIKPRYTPQKGEKVMTLAHPPRYSPGSPFDGRDRRINPRYSQEVDFPRWMLHVNPRYSPDPPFADKRYQVSPRYTIDKNFSLKRYWQLRHVPVRGTPSGFKGPVYVKMNKKRDFHPSANYLVARRIPTTPLKNAYRGWSILWNRMYGNNVQPDAVKDKISKPKFDKKEREIWNN